MKHLKITSRKKSYRQVSLSKKRTRTRLAFLAIPVFVWCLLFAFNVVTIGGVPASIIGKFLSDRLCVTAFFLGDGKTLHDCLEALGVEDEIKDYYRPQIPNEIELDQYIHQILFNSTGYVGNNYRLNSQGVLVLKDSGERRLLRFYDNCKKQVKGKKGFPKFQKDNRSVEYKQTGWKLSRVNLNQTTIRKPEKTML